jgi:hypothetical protein
MDARPRGLVLLTLTAWLGTSAVRARDIKGTVKGVDLKERIIRQPARRLGACTT